jgi:transposase
MSDLFGLSGRAILCALIAGGKTAVDMAKFARGHLCKKRPQLIEALSVEVDDHRRQLWAMQLARVEAAETDIATLDKTIAAHLAPYSDHIALLTTIPGVDAIVAAVIIAELGVDLTAFPTVRHLAAWIGVCPGNNESAGKTKPIGARNGNPYLTTALCNAAISASRKRGSFLTATYHRIKSRRGGGRAALAVAHKLAIAIYHMFTTGTVFKDLGDAYHDTRDKQRTAERYIRRLKRLGFDVTLRPLDPTPAQAA